MFGKNSWSTFSRTLELSSILINDDHIAALWHLICPSASSTLLVVRQAGGALVPVGLAIHANPEHTTVLLIFKCSPSSGTMWGGNWRFKLSSVPTLHKMKLIALFKGVGGVGVDEAKPVTTGPQLRSALLTVPVLVTTVQVWVEANMQVRAVEIISLTHYHCPQHSHHNYQIGIHVGVPVF